MTFLLVMDPVNPNPRFFLEPNPEKLENPKSQTRQNLKIRWDS